MKGTHNIANSADSTCINYSNTSNRTQATSTEHSCGENYGACLSQVELQRIKASKTYCSVKFPNEEFTHPPVRKIAVSVWSLLDHDRGHVLAAMIEQNNLSPGVTIDKFRHVVNFAFVHYPGIVFFLVLVYLFKCKHGQIWRSFRLHRHLLFPSSSNDYMASSSPASRAFTATGRMFVTRFLD